MKRETKQKTIQYKHAVLHNSDTTLEAMLVAALELESCKTAVSRQEPLGEGTGVYRLINRFDHYGGTLFGQLMLYEEGTATSLITLDETASHYSVRSIMATEVPSELDDEQLAEARREFVESLLYFLIVDNHVLVMGSRALRVRDLEAHLVWFLRGKTELLPEGSDLILQDRPPPEIIEIVEKAPVKALNIGSSIGSRPDTAASGFKRFVPEGRGVDLLSTIFGAEWHSKLNLSEDLDEANLIVELSLRYSQKTTEQGQKVLDSIATSLRSMEDEDFSLDVKGYGRIKGGELRLKKTISVPYINGAVVESELRQKMRQWLTQELADQDA